MSSLRFDADVNARSLGGLPLLEGGETVPGIWRSATPDPLSPEGWADVTRAGVIRIVDLRNPTERDVTVDRPVGLTVVDAPLEAPDDPDYSRLWDRNWAHPDFYAWGVSRWPHLWRNAFEAVGTAPAGSVLVHCAGGRDRTGIISAILLHTAGVERNAILQDYAIGMRGTNEMLRRQGRSAHEARIPDDRLPQVLNTFQIALGNLLDRASALLSENGLENSASRAAARLLP